MPFASPILRAAYPEYKSPYGPNGVNAGFFGGVAFFTLIFFTSGIPKIQNDVLFNLPVVGRFFENYFDKKIPASDSPF
ncbi:hypothetical protein QBC44DRAFT_373877 [Cladorrhinum sp. PSN332]|nr:hypothetical protein QBC44DRAFT_373877 [Cladorrhinum sp. PSN332]